MHDGRRTKACVGMKAFALFGGALLLVWLLFRSPDIGEHYLPPVAQVGQTSLPDVARARGLCMIVPLALQPMAYAGV